MPGTFPPAADFKGNRYLAIPACITARASRTCRDACRDRLPAVAGKPFPAFPAHAHMQFYLSGKRPMEWERLSNYWTLAWEVHRSSMHSLTKNLQCGSLNIFIVSRKRCWTKNRIADYSRYTTKLWLYPGFIKNGSNELHYFLSFCISNIVKKYRILKPAKLSEARGYNRHRKVLKNLNINSY